MEWTNEDPEGMVLGWPSKVSLKLMDVYQGLSIVKVKPLLTLSELSVLKRELDFYNRLSPTPACCLVVVTDVSHISREIKTLAERHSIVLHNMASF